MWSRDNTTRPSGLSEALPTHPPGEVLVAGAEKDDPTLDVGSEGDLGGEPGLADARVLRQ